MTAYVTCRGCVHEKDPCDKRESLAAIIIRAHIDAKRAEIAALCEIARGELGVMEAT